MAELLVTAQNHTLPNDPNKDRRGCYKRGYVVVIQPDGHGWGFKERPPWNVVIKVPGVPAASPVLQKYLAPELSAQVGPDGALLKYRRRRWQIRWADLPIEARTQLAAGGLTIKAGAYAGAADYTWAQIKGYFRDLKTGLDESEAL